MAKKQSAIVDAMFNEHIELPGCPQIVVTRAWAYRWLRDSLGFDPKARGFASLDYLVFARRETQAPLTDLSQPWATNLIAFIEQTETGKAVYAAA
jgi:hypothetical protein